MTAPTQDTFDDVLGAVASDWRPSREESREAIRVAVLAAAAAHGGEVTAATIRQHLPSWCNPAQCGAVMWRIQTRGYIARTIDPAGVQP